MKVTKETPQLKKLVQDINDLRIKHYNRLNLKYEPVVIDGGRKYLKLVQVSISGGKSAFAFIDTTNGNILKPASWKAPAKHARGNIFDENPMARMSVYGPTYLK